MRYELRSIGVWSFIKVAFFVNLVAGFVSGLLYAMFFGAMMAAFSQLPQFGAAFQEMQGIGMGVMLILFPIMGAFSAAFFGTLFGVIFVLIYNLTARLIGGLELDFQLERSEPEAVPGQSAVQASSPQPPPPPAPPQGESRDTRTEKEGTTGPVIARDPTVSTMTAPPVSEPRPTEPIPPEAPSEPGDDRKQSRANDEDKRDDETNPPRTDGADDSRGRADDSRNDGDDDAPEDRPRT